MNRDFDGLHAILGNVDPGAFDGAAGAVAVDQPLDVTPETTASGPPGSEEPENLELGGQASSSEDDGLSDLDHGVFGGGVAAVAPTKAGLIGLEELEDLFVRSSTPSPASNPGVDDLDRGLNEPASPLAGAGQPPPLAPRLTLPDRQPPSERTDWDGGGRRTPGRRRNDWIPALVVVLGMLFGASAALLAFHKEVSLIVANWE